MAFNNGGAAPKISKSFLLGWSDEPFKKPKPPPLPPPQPKPSGVSLSPDVIEWFASDGRKGKLKGLVNQPLSKGPVTQANLNGSPTKGAGRTKKRRRNHQGNLPAPPGTMDRVLGPHSKLHGTPAKLHATPAPADINAGLWAAFGNLGNFGGGNTPVQQPIQPPPAVAAANVQARSPAAAVGGDNPYSFTTAQDAELLRRKTENESWAVIGEALGKAKHELQERFKQIKPADWKPKPAETGKNKNKNKGGKEKKQEEKKESANETSGVANGGGDTIWGADWNFGGPDATAQADQAENAWNKDNSKWETKSHKSASKKGGSAAGRNNNGWSEQPGNTAHGISDVYPDDTFSMDDLALIARLLKRDHKQVWFRLSCAFKDKTGRYIPEDVFRKKLTGQSGK